MDYRVGLFHFPNACVAFHADRASDFRPSLISEAGESVMVHGFSEYQFGYQRVLLVRPAARGDARELVPNTSTTQNGFTYRANRSIGRGSRCMRSASWRPPLESAGCGSSFSSSVSISRSGPPLSGSSRIGSVCDLPAK